MSGTFKSERGRNTVLLIALGLLLTALVLKLFLSSNSELEKLARMLRERGYSVYADDIYVMDEYRNSTIAELLKPELLDGAVNESAAGGFPSRTGVRGDIVVMLIALEDKSVITLYMLDGEAELCFIQIPDSDQTRPLERAAEGTT